MKKLLLSSLCLLVISGSLSAQQTVSMSRSAAKAISAEQRVGYHNALYTVEEAPKNVDVLMCGNIVGITYYDLQTNASMPQKIVAHNDGTVSVVWTTCGNQATSRGTGYNYFDGTSWTRGSGNSAPTNRIENVRTGWGVIAAVGQSGEIVVSHNGSSALVVGVRPQKGTGDWTFTDLQGPLVHNSLGESTALLWPAIATNGNTIHLIACTDSDTGRLYQGIQTCLIYLRGTYNESANSVTWESPRVVGDVTPAQFDSFSGDNYAIAAKGNNVAVLVADTWNNDVFLWKSADNGVNFTKTTIVKTGLPDGYDEATHVIDTTNGHAIYVPDGVCALALSDNGTAHVSFGIMRIANPVAGDGYYTHYPLTDGLFYWNETMTPLLSGSDNVLDPDTLEANGYKVFYRPDLDGNGYAYFYTSLNWLPNNYRMTMSSNPQLAVENNNVYLLYSTYLDLPFVDRVKSYYYRGIFGTASADNGANWNGISWLSYNKDCFYYSDWSQYDTSDITSDNNINLIEREGENMYPCLASSVVNGKLNMVWQFDDFADNNGGQVASNDSKIYYKQLDANQLGVYNNTEEIPQGLWIDQTGIHSQTLSGMKLYPNPASDKVTLSLSSAEESEAALSVYNLMGQLVYSSQIVLTEGINQINVSTNDLTSGVYTVNVRTKKGTSTQKLIVR